MTISKLIMANLMLGFLVVAGTVSAQIIIPPCDPSDSSCLPEESPSPEPSLDPTVEPTPEPSLAPTLEPTLEPSPSPEPPLACLLEDFKNHGQYVSCMAHHKELWGPDPGNSTAAKSNVGKKK